jgi:hypothetical protein
MAYGESVFLLLSRLAGGSAMTGQCAGVFRGDRGLRCECVLIGWLGRFVTAVGVS